MHLHVNENLNRKRLLQPEICHLALFIKYYQITIESPVNINFFNHVAYEQIKLASNYFRKNITMVDRKAHTLSMSDAGVGKSCMH